MPSPSLDQVATDSTSGPNPQDGRSKPTATTSGNGGSASKGSSDKAAVNGRSAANSGGNEKKKKSDGSARKSGSPAGAESSRARLSPSSRLKSSATPSARKPSSSQKPRPTTDQLHLEQYVVREQLHAAAISAQSQSQAKLLGGKRQEIEYYKSLGQERRTNPGAIFGEGYAGYGNGTTDGKFQLVYPGQRRRPGRRSKDIHVPRKEMAAQADQLEELVPIRLDIDSDKVKLRDTFTWNLHDRVISPDQFAQQLVEDFQVPVELAPQFAQFASHEIQKQVQNFYPQVFIEEEALDPHLPYFAYKNDEMRILIKLSITIGQLTLIDQFEWEINNPLNSPEDFAKHMARDLALSGEFTTAIAHAIREQCQMFTRSLYIIGHPFDGRPIEDADLNEGFLPSPLTSVLRPMQHQPHFQPVLYEMTDAALDRSENSLSREQRRQKRSVNRRGGPALPDLKDRQRSVRTLIVSSTLPGAAENIDETRLFKRVEPAHGRVGRRAAHKAGLDDSDLSDSDDSGPDSPVVTHAHPSGTARTRGARGAASLATAAIKGAFGGSATPEPANAHHHETRTSARRYGGREREDSVDDRLSHIVVLRVSVEAARSWARRMAAGGPIADSSPRMERSHLSPQSATPNQSV
ncbi:MAG: hypothetical protein M1825_002102 [Sarcosagium campestre]|nr:MAG: hypothetical protein M1825_002102 [Sarcosagium campestre]